MNEDKKIILKTSLITLGVIMALAVMLFCINVFCYPAKVADFMFDLGLKTFASDLYYKEYEKTSNLDNLNKALSIRIELGHNGKIIELSKKFFDSEDYAEYVLSLNNKNLNSNFNLYTKSKLIAEDNYYKNAYIKALVAENKVAEAYEFSKTTFADSVPTFKDLKVYVFSNLLDEVDEEKLTEKLNSQDEVVLYEKINLYFRELYRLFENNCHSYESDDEVYVYALSSRILQVGNDLKLIAERVTTTLSVDEIDLKLNVVANFMQGLLEG